jgi:hypothetical protein
MLEAWLGLQPVRNVMIQTTEHARYSGNWYKASIEGVGRLSNWALIWERHLEDEDNHEIRLHMSYGL